MINTPLVSAIVPVHNGEAFLAEALAPRFYMQLGSTGFRSGVFDRVGLFDAELKFSGDIDWFLRAREKGVQIKAIDVISLLHRLHNNNMTRGTGLHDMRIAQIPNKFLDRRRAALADQEKF